MIVAGCSPIAPVARRSGAIVASPPAISRARPMIDSSRPAPAAGRRSRFGPYALSARDIFSFSPALRLRTVAVTVAPTVTASRARRKAAARRLRERRRKRAEVGQGLEPTQHLRGAEPQ